MTMPWTPALENHARQQVEGYIGDLARFLVAQNCHVPPWDPHEVASRAVEDAEHRCDSKPFVVTQPQTAYLESLEDAKDILAAAAAGYTGTTAPQIQVLGWCYKFELVVLGQGPESDQTYRLLLSSDFNTRLKGWFWRRLPPTYRSQADDYVLDTWHCLWQSMTRCCYACNRPLDRYVFGIVNIVLLGLLQQVLPPPPPPGGGKPTGATLTLPPNMALLRQMALHLIEGLCELGGHNLTWHRAAVLYLLIFTVRDIAPINNVQPGPATQQEQNAKAWLHRYLNRRGWTDPLERKALFNYLHQCGVAGLWSLLFPALPGRTAAPPPPASSPGEKRDALDAYASLGPDEFVVLFCTTTGLDQPSTVTLIGNNPSVVTSRLSSGCSSAASWMQGQGWPNAASQFQYILDYGLDRYLE